MKGLSRRTLLGAAAGSAGASGILLAGCGESGSDPSPERQAEALNDALELEFRTAATYRAAPRILSGRRLELAEQFARQEAEHIDFLERAVEELGGAPVESRSDEAYRSELPFDELEGQEDFLNVMVDLENTAIAVLGAAAARITVADMRRTLFTAIATEAEHLAVLLGELGEPQVPDTFVLGARTGVRGL